MKNVVFQEGWSFTNRGKTQIDTAYDNALCLAGFEENRASCAVPTWSDDCFHFLLSTAHAINAQNLAKAVRISQYESRSLPSRQFQIKHIFNESAKNERARIWSFVHPPYSPDLAPSEYYLFTFPQNYLIGVNLASLESCEDHLIQFFAQKSQNFYGDGVKVLRKKWQKIIDQSGIYLM